LEPNVIQDLRYSVRQLIKSPGFALTAILSLALGIGSTTAVFSVIYAALINPYPFTAADRIMRMSVRTKSGSPDTVGLNTQQIRQLMEVPLIESMLAMDFQAMTITGRELPENVNVIGIISNGFEDLGMQTALGRGLARSDAIEGRDPDPVIVLSYEFWQERLGGDTQIVGKTLQLDRKPYTVVGVAGPRFRWYSADVYLPLNMKPDPNHFCVVDFRLRPGVTHQAADAALEPLLQQFAREMPKRFPERFHVQVEGLNAWVERSIGGTLYLLLGAVALLLAIGCGNVSILLLAQGAGRQHEFAVRAAVGAQGRRLVRQLLTESMVLAGVGVALGAAASYAILAGIKAVLPRFAFAPEVVIRINLPVLFFSVAVGIATALLFGVWPALRLSRTRAGQLMVANTRRVMGSVGGRRTHSALIAVQIALTLVLLAGAGSATKGFLRMIRTPLGYDPRHVMSVGIPVRVNAYVNWAARAVYFEQLRAKVAETPGVTMAAVSSNATPPRNGWFARFEILGQPAAEQQKASVNLVSPGYFGVLRIPLLAGRIWDEAESRTGAHVAVINQAFASRYFPNGGAIGRSVKLPQLEEDSPGDLSAPKVADSWLQIVGVVGDARNDGLTNPVAPAVFIPHTLHMWRWTQILVKTQAPPLTLLHTIRRQLTAVDPEQQSAGRIEDLESWIVNGQEWQQQRLVAWIFGAFGVLALALAAVGLYSVVSYTVTQRTNEFGVRMALGAQRGHVLRIVFASTLRSVASGVAIGLAITVALNPILAQWAKGNSRDPAILLAGVLLLGLASAVASALPAWQASRLDPMKALRFE
jgi:predicted permease